MKISTKGRYALRLMIDLAQHSGGQFVALKDIAERQDISKKYLEQIVSLLNRAGFLKTNRGYQGGYMLARPAESYTVGDVLRITEGSLNPVSCMDDEPNNCPRCTECATLPVWEGLSKAINDYLDSVTIADIVENQLARTAGNYVI